jgi:hypothetical protein
MTLFGYVEVGCDFGDLRKRVITPQDHFQPRLMIFFLGWVGLGWGRRVGPKTFMGNLNIS